MGILIEDCTLWSGKPGSVYADGGRIVAVSGHASQQVPSGTVRLDAGGGSLFPGLTDTHCHPFEFGWLKRNVDLNGCRNITGIRLRLASRVQRAGDGEWVTGMGWDQEALAEGRMPSRQDIDDVSPRNPVVLVRVCGHIALLNGRAMALLGLDSRSGPEFERDSAGNLTGIVKESALEDVFASLPRSEDLSLDYLQLAEGEAVRLGLTTIHAVVSPDGYKEELAALARAAQGGSGLRYRVYIPHQAIPWVEEKGLRERVPGDRMRINGVKLYADGSLGARTAALREPYSDDPSNSGLLRYSDEELGSLVQESDSAGYQVVIHAIGDRAVEQALGALSPVSGGGNQRRHRIEHASVLPRDLLSRMSRLGIRAAVQPLFITSDTWASSRLGEERVRDLYPLKSMLKAGITASGSSDSPIESFSPLLGIWAAMARGGSSPEESLTLEEGFRLYTEHASSNGFDEGGSGLEEGSLADFTVLDSDVRDMHPALFRKVGVTGVVIGGDLVYGSPSEIG